MLTYFPKYFSLRGIIAYFITLILVSSFFMRYALPFQFVLFGAVSVCTFFHFSHRLTLDWQKYTPYAFTRKLFFTALVIRLVYVVFIYFYYIEMTGIPHAFHKGDEGLYQDMAALWKLYGYETFREQMRMYVGFTDSGYCWWLAIEYLIFGTHVLSARIIKCFIDAFSCVLMYNLAKRNFGEPVGRMAAIFCMLMPNMLFYCGVTLKETEMLFLVLLFAERADMVLRSPKIKTVSLILPGICILAMFTFRSALSAVMFAALSAALILSSNKQLAVWKKIVYTSIFAIWMLATVGVEMVQETQQLWEGRTTNQSVGYEWRTVREGGNTFAKYASASLFAPAIFTIPFSSMVTIQYQENQMMMNGANFIKNVLSGFTLFALFLMLRNSKWRQHVLCISLTCGYLLVLVFSNFAHSERFHFPVLAFELMFAAYGLTQLRNIHKRWFMIWLFVIVIANIIWAWIKLAGRGLV